MRAALLTLLALIAAAAAGTSATPLQLNRDPEPGDYLLGRGIQLPLERREKVFRPDVERAGFTFLHDVSNPAVRDGTLTFTARAGKTVIGWGNYMGRQRAVDVPDMWQQSNIVRIRLRQSRPGVRWTARLWRDGKSLEATASVEVGGEGWQEAEFKALASDGANPDGIELTLVTHEETTIDIEWLKLLQPLHEGYCRREFVLPEGEVWRAVANVGSMDHRHWYGVNEMSAQLYVNGRHVPRKGAMHLYHTAPVDLAPYLKPGPNCVGLYGTRIGSPPFVYLQCRVVMGSGDVVTIATGTDWKVSPRPAQGWSQPGFDDSTWSAAERGADPWFQARDGARTTGIPAYDGRLLIRNPRRRDLFFREQEDVVLEVLVPAGLARHSPSLTYTFGRCGDDGLCAETSAGSSSRCRHEGASLVFPLDLGRLGRGVYAIALRLDSSDGTVLALRSREPFVVLGRIAQTTVSGTSYTEGLATELEDVIDFASREDPHPWHEARRPPKPYGTAAAKVTEASVVHRDGLIYREVYDPGRGSGFAYRFEFARPGSFYLLDLEYPDNGARTMDVSISSKTEGVWTNSQSGVGVETGGRFLPTDSMKHLRWLHVADPGPHSVDVLNVVAGQRAAARSLRIYRIDGNLPALAGGRGRRYGIHTERCFYTSGLGMNFGVGQPRNRQEARDEDQRLPQMQRTIRDLVWLVATGERYVQYLRFCGQNCHIMGCVQYAEYNTPYVPAPALDDSRVLHCPKTVLANILDANDIEFFAGVEYSQSTDVRTYANDSQIARGADTMWMVDAQGRQRYGHKQITMVPNWMHPAVEDKYRELMIDLGRTFGHLASFRGVHAFLGPTIGAGYWIPGFGSGDDYDTPLAASFDDVTLSRFGEDSGRLLPIAPTDPDRYAKRAALLGTPSLQPEFAAWRCQRLASFFSDAVLALRRHAPRTEIVNVLAAEDTRLFQHLARSGTSFAETMRQFGIDLDMLGRVDGLWTGRWTISWRQTLPRPSSQDPYCWMARTSPDVASAFESENKRYVLVRTSWDENMLLAGGHSAGDRSDTDRLVESDWIMNAARIRALPQPGGFHCREAFTHAVITGDPELLIGGFTDININVGHEQMIRSLTQPYTFLPRRRFTPALGTGLETNLAIRTLTEDRQAWFYIANPCQWPVVGTVTVRVDTDLRDAVTGETVARGRNGDGVRLPFSLPPFGLRVFRTMSPDLAVTAYTTEPPAPTDLGRLSALPERVRELLSHPESAISLSLPDRAFMRHTLEQISDAIEAGNVARAWSLLTHHRFWSLWHDFLEQDGANPGPGTQVSPRIEYDSEHNRIFVLGFAEENPATMADILAADRQNGWGAVAHDMASDTYTVGTDLWIGDDQGLGTFVQIGDAQHPRVTVVINGTVWVRPPQEGPARSDGLPSVINRLRLGLPGDDSVSATLAFDCESRGQHGLYVGYRAADSQTWIRRGSLHVYNSTLTAATKDRDHAWGVRDYTGPQCSPRWSSPGWYGSDVRLVNAVVSWFEGCVAYGLQTGERRRGTARDIGPSGQHRIEGTLFEHGGYGVQNSAQYLRNCVFRGMEVGVAEGGALSAKLIGCTFSGNKRNWTLGSLFSGGLCLLDCDVGEPEHPPAIRKNRIDPAKAARHGVAIHPACALRRSLVVQVRGPDGTRVPGAVVTVQCDDAPVQVTQGAAVTDANGETPRDPEQGAVVVTERRLTATDVPEQPEERTFLYRVVVTAPGHRPTELRLDSAEGIPSPLVVTVLPPKMR